MNLHFYRKLGWVLIFLLPTPLASACTSLMELKPVGQAQLSVWGFSVYSARSMSCDGQSLVSIEPLPKPFALELTYARHISQQALLEATRSEWQKLNLDPDIAEQWLAQLSHFWPSVDRDDQLTLFVDGQGESHFYLAGKFIGGIKDPGFGGEFIGIWLDENASYQDLRRALLGREG